MSVNLDIFLELVKALEQIEKQLEELHREEVESKEVELKAAQERRRAIEDMEKGVRSLGHVAYFGNRFRCMFKMSSGSLGYFKSLNHVT